MPGTQACLLSLASVPTNHSIATSAKHPLSRGAGGGGYRGIFLANWQTCRELTSCSFHRRGSGSPSTAGALIASVTHISALVLFFLSLERASKTLFLLYFPSCVCICCSHFSRRPRGSCDTVQTAGDSDPSR